MTAEEYLKRGVEFNENKEYGQAIEDFTKVISLNPKNAEAYYNRGLSYSLSEKNELAIDDYIIAISLDSKNAEVYYNRGISYALLEKHESAIEDYTIALSMDSKMAGAYYNRGVSYALLEKYETAIDDYTIAISLRPKKAVIFNNRGISYGSLGKYELAIVDYTKAISLDSENEELYYNRGFAFDSLGKYELAIEDYTTVISIDPKNTNAYINRGFAFDFLGKYELAIEDYTIAISLNPKDSNTFNNRGLAYASLGKYELAIKDYTIAISLNPKDAIRFINRGLAYHGLKVYEKAIENYSRAIFLAPNELDSFINRGLAYNELGQHENALEDYNHVISIRPNDTNTFNNRGITHYLLKSYKKALEDFNQVLYFDPNNYFGFNNRGMAYYKIGKYDKAINNYLFAISLKPEDKKAYYNIGVVYYKLDNLDKALENYNQAIYLDPKFGLCYYNRSKIYLRFSEIKGKSDLFKGCYLNPKIEINEATVVRLFSRYYKVSSAYFIKELIPLTNPNLLYQLHEEILNNFYICNQMNCFIEYSITGVSDKTDFNKYYAISIINYCMGNPVKSYKINKDIIKDGNQENLQLHYLSFLSAIQFLDEEEYEPQLNKAIGIAEKYLKSKQEIEKGVIISNLDEVMQIYYAGQILYFDTEYEDALNCFLQIKNNFLPAAYMAFQTATILKDDKLKETLSNYVLEQESKTSKRRLGYLDKLGKAKIDLDNPLDLKPFLHYIWYEEIKGAIQELIEYKQLKNIVPPIDQPFFYEIFSFNEEEFKDLKKRINKLRWKEIGEEFTEQLLAQNEIALNTNIEEHFKEAKLKESEKFRSKLNELQGLDSEEKELLIATFIQNDELKNKEKLHKLITLVYATESISDIQALMLHIFTETNYIKKNKLIRTTKYEITHDSLKQIFQNTVPGSLAALTGAFTTHNPLISIAMAGGAAAFSTILIPFINELISTNKTTLTYESFKIEFNEFLGEMIEKVGEEKLKQRFDFNPYLNWLKKMNK